MNLHIRYRSKAPNEELGSQFPIKLLPPNRSCNCGDKFLMRSASYVTQDISQILALPDLGIDITTIIPVPIVYT